MNTGLPDLSWFLMGHFDSWCSFHHYRKGSICAFSPEYKTEIQIWKGFKENNLILEDYTTVKITKIVDYRNEILILSRKLYCGSLIKQRQSHGTIPRYKTSTTNSSPWCCSALHLRRDPGGADCCPDPGRVVRGRPAAPAASSHPHSGWRRRGRSRGGGLSRPRARDQPRRPHPHGGPRPPPMKNNCPLLLRPAAATVLAVARFNTTVVLLNYTVYLYH